MIEIKKIGKESNNYLPVSEAEFGVLYMIGVDEYAYLYERGEFADSFIILIEGTLRPHARRFNHNKIILECDHALEVKFTVGCE